MLAQIPLTMLYSTSLQGLAPWLCKVSGAKKLDNGKSLAIEASQRS